MKKYKFNFLYFSRSRYIPVLYKLMWVLEKLISTGKIIQEGAKSRSKKQEQKYKYFFEIQRAELRVRFFRRIFCSKLCYAQIKTQFRRRNKKKQQKRSTARVQPSKFFSEENLRGNWSGVVLLLPLSKKKNKNKKQKQKTKNKKQKTKR